MASDEAPQSFANGKVHVDHNDQEHADKIAKPAQSPNETKNEGIQPSVSKRATDLTSYALQFLSNATNETLGACIIGLCATTYFVLGRVGLVLIGVIGGVLLQATWDHDATKRDDDGSKSERTRRQRETGLDIVSRLLNIRGNGVGSAETEREYDATRAEKEDLDYDGFKSETRNALRSFTDAVIQDYVKWWYSPIIPKDLSFPAACRQILTTFIIKVSKQLSRKRPADTFLEFLTNSSSIVIVFLSELSAAFKQSSRADCAEVIYEYILNNPESSLANVLDEEQQEKKLKGIADDVLQSFLDAKAYGCEPVKVFLQQILASLILESTVISCSRAEFINEWIVYSLEDEQKSELVRAIDAGVSGAAANDSVMKGVKATASKADIDADSETRREHKRTVSRAEEAMDEAMQEAKRLSALIATEEDKKKIVTENGDPSRASNGLTPHQSANLPDAHHEIDQGTKHLAPPDRGHVPPNSAPGVDEAKAFTTFDQIISSKPTALQENAPSDGSFAPMSLHNATVSIFDDAVPGEKTTIKAKPTVEYLLQIEPAISQYPGWMIARKYPDFETMHEVLRRIAVISGVTAFTQRNPILPNWKNKTKSALRVELERYLRDALSFDRLAESEGMKRFLEKDQGLAASSGTGNKGAFGFPSPAAFETMGKGMLDVLASAPKGVAGGGKAVVGGVAGVFGGKGQKNKSLSPHPMGSGNASATSLGRVDSDSYPSSVGETQEQQHDLRSSDENHGASDQPPQPLDHPIHESLLQNGSRSLIESSEDHPKGGPAQISDKKEAEIHLPPPPSEIEDDYETIPSSPKLSLDEPRVHTPQSTLQSSRASLPPDTTPPPKSTRRREFLPLSGEETSVAVELFFATINELYTLSSAWALRLTLLNAAKSFLLRPGNPNLEAIRQLLQSTIIDSQSTDSAIASYICKTRENALPTQEELKLWPPHPTDEEKENLRKKARKLLVEKGMPAALTSVMGAAASGEALGKVFDCLQVPKVAKGLVFALVLQAVRAVTH